jgi:choline dehydrogenase-like flavoprotein
MRYALFRQGMQAHGGAPIRAFVCSREGLEAPNLMLGLIPMLTEPSPRGPRISRQPGVTLYAHPMRPESKGQIHITAADPRRPPAINFNFLSSPPDAELTVRAVRITRAIMTAPAAGDAVAGPQKLVDARLAVIRACNAAVRQNRIPLGLPVLSIKPKW